MDIFKAWMAENPKMAAAAMFLGLLFLGSIRLFVIGDRAEAAKKSSQDEANDHHNDMIAGNRSAEAGLNKSRRSVGDWIKKVRGGG